MSFFEFPHTRTYDSDLGWLIRRTEQLSADIKGFMEANTLRYADPLEWSIANQYTSNTMTVHDGTMYISRQPVPAGIDITNGDYWELVGAFSAAADAVRRCMLSADIPQLQGLIVGDLIQTAGYYAAGDGGGALFYVASEAPAARYYIPIDNLYAVLVSGDVVNVRQMGAHGDGVTDDTEVLQRAAAIYKTLYLPTGTYMVSDTLSFTGYKQGITGDGAGSRLYMTAADRDAVLFSHQYGLVSDLTLETAAAAANTAAGIRQRNTFYMVIHDVTINGFSVGIEVDGTGSEGCVFIDSIRVYNFNQYGICINKALDITVNNFYLHAFSLPAEAGIYLYNKVEGIICTNGHIFRCAAGIATGAEAAYTEEGRDHPAFCRFDNILLDSYSGSCILDKVTELLLTSCWFSYNSDANAPNLTLTRCIKAKFIGCEFISAMGSGVTISDTCRDIILEACTFRQFNRSNGADNAGVYVNGSQVVIADCLFTDQTNGHSKYAVEIAAGGISTNIHGCVIERMKTAPIKNALTLESTYQVYGNQGVANSGGTFSNQTRINNTATAFEVAVPNWVPNRIYSVTVINGNLQHIGSIEIGTAGAVRIFVIAGISLYTASFDTATKVLTITPTETLWGNTVVLT